MGFAEYFLIVWDFVRYAKSNDIRVGPGRGSAAGSIVSYLLDITDIEPLQYDLLFERFLNEERKKMPDIDIDFCDEKRDKVLDYVSDKYGENRVAQLITFGTMAARQAIRDSGRVLEVPYSEVDKIAKLVPAELNMTIDNAIDRVPELQEGYNTDKKIRDIIDTARSLEGKARQHSIHAAGVVISAEELFNYTPIQQDDRSGEIKTQYKMEDVQDIGLLKMDFLGLKTLSLIDKTLFLISKTRGEDIDINDISLEDRKTYRMLGSGDCLGVFQLESSGMRELIISLRPERFEDIIATLALFRPGPLQSGMVKDFVEAKNKKRKIKYLHSSLEPILKETYGIIVYQEQIMMIASKLAGFSMSEADILRDAISKKKSGLMAKQKTKFLNSAGNIGIIDKKTAEELFKLITHFAEYGFNKSHSTAYAMISYQTAYLKANYPVEFLAAILSIRMGSQEKVAQYINEARRIGIRVLPPDINESFADFTVVGKSIRFGLSAIKNVGSNVIELIVKERKEKGRFADFHDFCRRASSTVLNKKTVESLIKAGVFDSLRCSRKFLLENCENIVDEAAKMKKRAESGQFSLFDETENEAGYSFDHKYPEREEFLKEAIQEEYSSRMLLNFEKEILGLYISGHPLADYEDLVSGFTTVDNLDREKDKSTQVIAGVVVSIKQIMTRSNQPMYFLTLEDLTDSIEVIIFPAVLEKFRAIIEEDKVLWIKGKLDKKEDQTKFIAIEIEDLKKMRGRKKTVSSADDMEEKIIVENPAGNVEDNSTGFYNNRSTGTDTGHVSEDTGELARNRLILKINKDVLDRDVINKLYEIIGKNPGSITVELKITNGNNNEIEKSYSFPQSYGIDLNNSLFEQLRSQFGEFISWEMPPDIK